jgi:hypothetical protein
MATLYVENIPDDLYESLRTQARKQRRSIAAEILTLLEQNFPNEKELQRRQRVWRDMQKSRPMTSPQPRPFQSTEDMIREDRER